MPAAWPKPDMLFGWTGFDRDEVCAIPRRDWTDPGSWRDARQLFLHAVTEHSWRFPLWTGPDGWVSGSKSLLQVSEPI